MTLANGAANSGYIPNDAAFEGLHFRVLGSRLKPGCVETSIANSLVDLIQERPPLEHGAAHCGRQGPVRMNALLRLLRAFRVPRFLQVDLWLAVPIAASPPRVSPNQARRGNAHASETCQQRSSRVNENDFECFGRTGVAITAPPSSNPAWRVGEK